MRGTVPWPPGWPAVEGGRLLHDCAAEVTNTIHSFLFFHTRPRQPTEPPWLQQLLAVVDDDENSACKCCSLPALTHRSSSERAPSAGRSISCVYSSAKCLPPAACSIAVICGVAPLPTRSGTQVNFAVPYASLAPAPSARFRTTHATNTSSTSAP